MRYPVLTLRRADLVRADACAEWLDLFDEVCRLRGDDRAPIVRRPDGTTRRDPSRLRIELTPTAQALLSLRLSETAGSAWAWLRARRIVGGANLRVANLRDADLRRAALRDADLRGADLRRADLRMADLRGADLRGAALRGADLRGADRLRTDTPIPGWVMRDGRLRKAAT
jgi:uncharacterized protein YjbI with pentapeptide repeats